MLLRSDSSVSFPMVHGSKQRKLVKQNDNWKTAKRSRNGAFSPFNFQCSFLCFALPVKNVFVLHEYKLF